jgi:hypothetical protein
MHCEIHCSLCSHALGNALRNIGRCQSSTQFTANGYIRNKKFDCGAVPYGRAIADSANAAEVDRVNVSSSFRWTRSFKSSNLRNGQRYRNQTLIRCSVRHYQPVCRFQCRWPQWPIFGEFSGSAENPLSETDPESPNRYITKTLCWISSFLRQSLVFVRRYQNVEFHLPKKNTKNVVVGVILKIGVTFWSNSDFYSEKLETRWRFSSTGTFPPSLATKTRNGWILVNFRKYRSGIGKQIDPKNFKSSYLRNG